MLKFCAFTVQTDNRTICSTNFLKKSQDAKLLRWAAELQEYQFTLEWISTAQNLLSDVLSRFRKKDDFKDDDGGPQDEDSEDMVYVIKEDAPKVEKILEAEPGPSNVKRWPEIDIRASVLTDEEGEGMNMLDTATTSIKIAGRQDEDPDLKVVKRVIKDKNYEKVKKTLSKDQRRHLMNHKLYSLDENNCLVRRVVEKYGNAMRKVIVLPNDMHVMMIDRAHSLNLSGHFGADKTIALLKERFFMLDLRMQVNLFLAKCHHCIMINAESKKKPKSPMQIFPAVGIGECLQCDFAGPFTQASNGYKYYILHSHG